METPGPRRGGSNRAGRWLGSALLVLGCAAPTGPAPAPAALTAPHVVDLTHAFDADTIYWPTEEGFVLDRGFEGVTEAGYYYAAHRFRAPEHGGTHIDAPVHFYAEGRSVDEIPVDELMGPGVLIDVSDACAADRDYRIRISDLEWWEADFGRIPSGALVLLRTGFGRYWPDREQYMGTAARGPSALQDLHFPGLDPAAARWLADERRVAAVGLDTPSIDPGQSTRFESHVALFERGVPALENLANLELLPATGFQVIALPLKIRGGSGAPVRAVALLPTASPR